MNLLDDIYNEVHARGLVRSRRGFSREFLRKAHNYATAGKTRSRPSPDALVSLSRRLVEVGASDLARRVMTSLLAQQTHGSGAFARPDFCSRPITRDDGG